VRATDDRARVKPLSAKRFAVQFTVDESTHELLRHAQELLGQRVAPGDVADVFTRALKAYVALLERAKFAATDQPQARSRRMAADSRHIPARMKRAVWARDGGQCTFVSDAGLRCDARASLEFDHVQEFARGGEATVDNIQLRCRGHNQHTAERTFGAEFMRQKRAEAAEARARAKAARERAWAEKAEQAEQARLHPHQLEVLPYLRKLGCRDGESREAVALCRNMIDASLEARVKRALSMFGARCGRKVMPVAPAANEPLLAGGAPPSRIPMAVETERGLQSVPSRM
jgi:5-methylcytosine-specific restriction endonuclease McrA